MHEKLLKELRLIKNKWNPRAGMRAAGEVIVILCEAIEELLKYMEAAANGNN